MSTNKDSCHVPAPTWVEIIFGIAAVLVIGWALWASSAGRLTDALKCEKAGGELVRVDKRGEICVKIIKLED